MNGVFYFSEGAFDTFLDEGLYFGGSHDVVRNVRFGVHFAGFAQFADFVYNSNKSKKEKPLRKYFHSRF
ncbi:hypothetical protein D3H55_20285 [Bacillus salacetis]|uniref:Uncharacterized protein n=1 Tax=Bacillus salacetis TaxID=2315464 RepID=A0A3A1QRL5_9BACI|nr:hypothetical protein D3H55_20285 [Bacillus salacetis]